MPLLIEGELAALAHHQHIAKLRCSDGWRGTSAFADLLILRRLLAVPKNRSECEQSRIAIEHDAPINLRAAFQNGRGKVGKACFCNR